MAHSILIVDDDESTRGMLTQLLQSQGYETATAAHVERARQEVGGSGHHVLPIGSRRWVEGGSTESRECVLSPSLARRDDDRSRQVPRR